MLTTRRKILYVISGAVPTGLAGCAGLSLGGRNDLKTRYRGSPSENTRPTRVGSMTESADGRTMTDAPTPNSNSPGPTETHSNSSTKISPVIFLNTDEATAIKEKVEEGERPWILGYNQLMKDAEKAMNRTRQSVVDNGAPTQAPNDSNKFGTTDTRVDYIAALHMADWTRNLGLAYVFSGSDRYAHKAIDFLHKWFIDSDTRMYPSARNFGETYLSIELHITIPPMIYAASLVSGHPYWSEKGSNPESKLDQWVADYLDDLEQGDDRKAYRGIINNNIYDWWIVARATAAAFLDDRNALESAFDDWKSHAFEQLEKRGTLKYERHRENGLLYSLYGIKAITLTAEIARHHGVNLYDYKLDDERVLRKIFDHHVQYLHDPSKWKWGTGPEGFGPKEREEGASVYELAYSFWEDSDYLDVIKIGGRPVYDRWMLGWTTLTHGNLFALDATQSIYN